MMWLLSVAFLVAALFPYTQFLPIDTYTQPYAIAFGLLIFLLRGRQVLESVPRSDALGLLALAFFGTTAFIIDCLPVPNQQEIKYLLIYLSPLVLTVAGVSCLTLYPQTCRRVVSICAVIWLGVGFVQTMVSPTFMTSLVGTWQDASEVVVRSGRGVLGLAPEPTHFGFHLIILGALVVLTGGSRVLAWCCIIGVLLLARSTSAALALALGACVFALRMPMKYKLPILLGAVTTPFVIYALLERIDPEKSRLLYLAGAFLSEPSTILQIDWSVNVRMGGMIATVRDSFGEFLLPHGLSHENWIDHSREIVQRLVWLFEFSDAGPPTGFGVVIYQLGLIGLLLLIRPISRMMTTHIHNNDQIIILAVVWVFLGQFYISTPGYSLVYAGVICLVIRQRQVRTNRNDIASGALQISAPGVGG
jgi:hypothetical protein